MKEEKEKENLKKSQKQPTFYGIHQGTAEGWQRSEANQGTDSHSTLHRHNNNNTEQNTIHCWLILNEDESDW